MKKFNLICIMSVVCMCCFSCTNNESTQLQSEWNDSDNSLYTSVYASSGNNTIDNQMKEFIFLNNAEKIAYQSFVTDCCYRVSITSDSTYFNDRFTRDYFFFDDEKIHPLIVEYPSDNDTDTDRKVYNNCTFSAKFEDITFDGNDDLLISLGYVGIPEWECFCAYIYKDGQYEYNKSFEQIVDYKIDSVGNLLIGSKLENAMHDNPFYFYYVNDKHTIIYENDRFVLSEIPYEADPSAASDYIRKVLQNETSLIDETGNLSTWEEYEYESVSFWNESDSYAYIDLDCDGEKELIVNAMGYSAILDYQEQNVYCYTFPSRAINRIRADGVFHDGGAGAGVNAFYKIKFYHGLYIKYCVQCFDNSNSGYFFINNTEVTKEEFDKISYDYLNDNSYYEFNPYDIEMIISEL